MAVLPRSVDGFELFEMHEQKVCQNLLSQINTECPLCVRCPFYVSHQIRPLPPGPRNSRQPRHALCLLRLAACCQLWDSKGPLGFALVVALHF